MLFTQDNIILEKTKGQGFVDSVLRKARQARNWLSNEGRHTFKESSLFLFHKDSMIRRKCLMLAEPPDTLVDYYELEYEK